MAGKKVHFNTNYILPAIAIFFGRPILASNVLLQEERLTSRTRA